MPVLATRARTARRFAAAVALAATTLALLGCEPAPLTSPPVVPLSTAGSFVGDGFQHGPAGSTTYDVIRDSDYPTTMPDGYVLQVYSDTTSTPTGTPQYFQTNSAALSPAGSAQSTVEWLQNDHPMAVLPWTSNEAAAVIPSVRYTGVWPTGAAWIPANVTGGNRVVMTYRRVFVDMTTTPPTFTLQGQGVASFNYLGAQDAVANGLHATRLNDDLFPAANDVVMGTPVYYGGWVYLYGCSTTIKCFSARVRPAQIADPLSWVWFDGTSYAGTRAQRQPIVGVGEFSLPIVQWIPAYKAYAMTSTRTTNVIAVRWSSTPSGPWTSPQLLTLPGCGLTLADGGCYGAAVRPESTTSSLLVSYAAFGQSRTRVAGFALT